MKIVLDIESNALINPTKVWVIVTRDLLTGTTNVFRHPTDDDTEAQRFREYTLGVQLVVGHNILSYDRPVLHALLDWEFPAENIIDTLIVSKLVDYPRKHHSVEDYGVEFGLEKINWHDYSKYSIELENYCIRDVDITEKIYLKYKKYIDNPIHRVSMDKEHRFQCIVNSIENKGFTLDTTLCTKLLNKVHSKLTSLDKDIASAFPPRLKLIREVMPKETKYGTISLTSIPKDMRSQIADLTVGAPFSYCHWVDFNPSSHKQIINVLNEAGWQPVVKTDTHIDSERTISKLKRIRNRTPAVDLELQLLYTHLKKLKLTGYKVNEENLSTLPSSAPKPARTISERILYEARRRTLTEWLGLVRYEIEIKLELGTVIGIEEKFPIRSGSLRNVYSVESINSKTLIKSEKLTELIISNIPTDYRSKKLLEWLKSKKVDAQFVKENANSMWITVTGQDQFESFSAALATWPSAGLKSIQQLYKITSTRVHGKFNGIGAWSHRMNHQKPNMANITNEFDLAGKVKLLGKELRQCWTVPKERLLVGVDAEGIQLRIFAHYINDPEFTDALVRGKKDDKTDPHSLNQRVLGGVCKSRAAAKRFIFALLLGGGLGKLSEILDCSNDAAQQALDRILVRYPGFAYLKETSIPKDAKRGWFTGLDGRKVRILGETEGTRRHLCMSGYLQNGEAVVIKTAAIIAEPALAALDSYYVDIIHDEYQVEVPNDFKIAKEVCEVLCRAITEAGSLLGLRCPLAGSYWNDDHKEFTIGRNWWETH